MALIGYAGHAPQVQGGKFEERCKRADMRFRLGLTTLQIAAMMSVSEATALRYVTLGRCMRKNLKVPF